MRPWLGIVIAVLTQLATLPLAHAGIIIIAIIDLISLGDPHAYPLWEVVFLNIIASGREKSRNGDC